MGDAQGAQIFHRVLAKVQDQRFTQNNLDPAIENWSVDLVIALQAAVDAPGPSSTIGGRIQTLIIKKDEIGQKQWSRIAVGVDLGDPAKWEQITVPLENVKPLRDPRDPDASRRA